MLKIYKLETQQFAPKCKDCEYLKSFKIMDMDKNSLKCADVYRSCDKSISEFIIVFGNQNEDYVTLDQDNLFSIFIASGLV